MKGEGRVEYEGSRWGTGDNLLCRRGGGRVFKRYSGGAVSWSWCTMGVDVCGLMRMKVCKKQ